MVRAKFFPAPAPNRPVMNAISARSLAVSALRLRLRRLGASSGNRSTPGTPTAPTKAPAPAPAAKAPPLPRTKRPAAPAPRIANGVSKAKAPINHAGIGRYLPVLATKGTYELLQLSREPLTVVIMQDNAIRGPPCRYTVIVSLRRAGCQAGERRYPGLAQGQEGAAAIVLPNGFQENWFHCQAENLTQAETFHGLEKELEGLVPMVVEMDPRQRDMLVLALGAGIPTGY